jgi:hypothetical protein
MGSAIFTIVFKVMHSILFISPFVIPNISLNLLSMFLAVPTIPGFLGLRIFTMKLLLLCTVMICLLSPVLPAPFIYSIKISLLIAFYALFASPVQPIRPPMLLTKRSLTLPPITDRAILTLTTTEQANMLEHNYLEKQNDGQWHLPVSTQHYAFCRVIIGNVSVAVTDSGMVMLVKKNAGLFSQKATIHPKINPAFHSAVARRSERFSIMKAYTA